LVKIDAIGRKGRGIEHGTKGSHHVRKTVYPSSLILASFYQALKSLGNGLSTLTN